MGVSFDALSSSVVAATVITGAAGPFTSPSGAEPGGGWSHGAVVTDMRRGGLTVFGSLDRHVLLQPHPPFVYPYHGQKKEPCGPDGALYHRAGRMGTG